MYIKVSTELKDLADIFEKNGEVLYIVGGYVRDSILGLKNSKKNDIDLCSSCRPDKLVKMLKNTQFETNDKFSKLGTVIIQGKLNYEHTTFRRENYNQNGEHSPSGIEFIKDINLDARRRDFTINAIYYNICTGEIENPVLGLEHLKQGVLATPINSEQSFREDSERILRMIRFACTFNFLIEEKTLVSAVNLSNCVQNLSKARIRNEFDKMLICDTYYPRRKESLYAHAKCMILLGKLDLWPYVMPAIEQIQKSGILDSKGDELYTHIISALAVCEPEARLACLLHDVGKAYTKEHSNSFSFSGEWSDIIIQNNLGAQGLNYPKKVVEETQEIVKALDWDRLGIQPSKKVKKFIRQNLNNFEKICMVKNAVALENTDYTQKSQIAFRWNKIYQKMKSQKTPLSLSELDINGNDIKSLVPQIDTKLIGEVLNYLLDYCLYHPSSNVNHLLKELAKNQILKNPNKYLK